MKTVYKHVNLLDGRKDMELQKDVDILVEENIIKEVGKDLKGDKEVNLAGKYVIPGLINLHVHIPGSGIVKAKPTDTKKLVKLILGHKCFYFLGRLITKKYAQIELKTGVTTIRSVGGVGHFDTDIRDQINAGKLEGPRILASNTALTVAHGHMEGTVARACSSLEEFSKGLDELKSQNVDWIKIMITGGVLDCTVKGEPGEMRMTPEQVKFVCDKAHKLGFKVAAHVESPEGVKVAIENGVDTIEHGAVMSKETIKIAKKNKAAIVTTLSPAVPLSLIPEEESYLTDFGRYNSYVVLDNVIKCAKQAMENDIPLGCGTDTGCPFTTHYNFYRELVWAKNLLGMNEKEAIYFGTLNNAKVIGIDEKIGSIEPNKFADFVVLNENPLDDLSVIGQPCMVIKDGKQVKNLKVKKNKYVDEHLDKIMDFDVDKEVTGYLKEHK